jgi:hypothetical protein
MVGVRYSARASGRVPRFVTCEQCSHGYGYWLERTGFGGAHSYFGIGMIGGRDRAASRAEANLEQRLRTECDAVPCPSCGWYQEHMIPQARREKFGWLYRGGWIVFAGAFFLLILSGCAIGPLLSKPLLLAAARAVQLFLVLALLAPLPGYLLMKFLGEQYRPNDDAAEERQERGKRRAMRKKEYARLVPKEPPEELPGKLRLEDL